MPLPPYLLSIYAFTLEGEPMVHPTWIILGDTQIQHLGLGNPGGIILLGEQSTGHYLVDPADIGLDYQTCRAYVTARDMYATLVSEAALPTGPFEAHLIRAQAYAQCLIRDTTLKAISNAALIIGPAHFTPRYIMP